MIERLPIEIRLQLIQEVPVLAQVSRSFYMLHNEVFYTKIVADFGFKIIDTLSWLQSYFKSNIKYLDQFRYASRLIVAKSMQLKDDGGLQSEFIADSWQYIYSILKNKRLFIQKDHYMTDEFNYELDQGREENLDAIQINKTYLLYYQDVLYLTPGRYNLNMGIKIKSGNGLGTARFQIAFKIDSKEFKFIFYPPTNIHEILPKNEFCVLKISEFEIPEFTSKSDRTVKVELSVEETGLNVKTGFNIYFFDFSLPTVLFNDLLYYSVNDEFIYLPYMEIYRYLNAMQENVLIHDLIPRNVYTEQLNLRASHLNSECERTLKFKSAYQRNQFYLKYPESENDKRNIKLKLPVIQKL